jgi:hypothetical protein
MDPVTLDNLAIASTRLRVAGLREGDLRRPTVNAGWDVRLDPDLCAAATAIISRFPASTWGNPKFYAERVPTDSTDPADRLIALTGRDPRHHLDGVR